LSLLSWVAGSTTTFLLSLESSKQSSTRERRGCAAKENEKQAAAERRTAGREQQIEQTERTGLSRARDRERQSVQRPDAGCPSCLSCTGDTVDRDRTNSPQKKNNT